MNVTEMLGNPVHDQPDPVVPHPPACSTPSTDRQDPQPASVGRRGLLVVAGIAVAVGAAIGWLVSSLGEAAGDPILSDVAPISIPADVAGTAEMFTSLYLAGNAPNADLAAFYAGLAPQPTTAWINTATTIGAEMVGDHVWNVVVAVDSLEKVDDIYQAVDLSYYVVPISIDSGRPIAIGAPGRIPPPTPVPRQENYNESIPADQATSAANFLELYLTGGDDAARYLSALARIPSFATPPYATAMATPQGADASGRVRVAVTATNERGTTHQLEYIVSLSFDGTVWEVSDMSAGAE
jgi:hypothetical protein